MIPTISFSCRNLLIYLDGTSQQKLLVKVRRLLAPNGLLFVGPAELPLATNNGFTANNVRLSFACRKVVSPRKSPRDSHAPKNARHPAISENPNPSVGRIATARELHGDWNAISPAMQPPQQLADLREARELAQAGCLHEAAAICEAHMRLYGVSADAFYLLGLIRDYSGADSQAMEFYRKALYLQPKHYEALIQWASLAGKRTAQRRPRTNPPKPRRAC